MTHVTAGRLSARCGVEAELRDGLTVGRAPGAGLRLDDPSVSREHAMVRRAQSSWTVSDRGSRNGTLLNGTRIPMYVDCPLRDGDRLEFGRVPVAVKLAETERRDESGRPDETASRDETVAISLADVRDAAAGVDPLSPYQLQVVRCLAEPWVQGGEPATNAQIASELGTPLAVDAVKAALRRAYVKTGLADLPTHTKRRELCRLAQDRRWL